MKFKIKNKIVLLIAFFLNLNAVFCQDNNNSIISDATFFKMNSVYTTEPKNDSISLFYFSSNDSAVYISKIKTTKYESVSKSKDLKFPTDFYGKYTVEGNLIKMQGYIARNVKIRRNFFKSLLFTFLPIPRSPSSYNLTIYDKPIINEGTLIKDSIIITKEYFGSKKSNFKKAKLSKTHKIKLNLILNPNLTGILVKEYENADYNAVIISK